MIRLLPLGINGFFPSYGRQTMSFLLLRKMAPCCWMRVREYVGSGAGHSETATALRQAPYPAIALPHRPRRGPTLSRGTLAARLYSNLRAEPALGRQRTRERPPHILSPPVFGLHYSAFPAPIELFSLREPIFQVGALMVRMWRQIHPGGSVGFRIGDAVAYATDTAPNPAAAESIAGVDLLLHELWTNDAAPANPDSAAHSHFDSVAQLAREARVGSLMLVHHPPSRRNAEIRRLTEEMQRVTEIQVLLPKEGKLYDCAAQPLRPPKR